MPLWFIFVKFYIISASNSTTFDYIYKCWTELARLGRLSSWVKNAKTLPHSLTELQGYCNFRKYATPQMLLQICKLLFFATVFSLLSRGKLMWLLKNNDEMFIEEKMRTMEKYVTLFIQGSCIVATIKTKNLS